MLKRPLARFVIRFALISILCVLADLCVSFARDLPSRLEPPHREVLRKVAKARQDANQTSPDGRNFVRLFKLEGTFGEEIPVKNRSIEKSKDCGFVLTRARLEADNFGFSTRLRSILTITNSDVKRRITEVEWRIDIYDAALGPVGPPVLQSEKINIYAGETAATSGKFGAVLPDRMVVLLQLSRVSFDDGSEWSASEECSLEEDLRTISCKSK